MKYDRFIDRFAEDVGKTLLDHFDSGKFPMGLLRQDQTLRFLYMKFQCEKASRDKSLTTEQRIERYRYAMQEFEERGGFSQ